MEKKKIILLFVGLFLIGLVYAVPDFGSIPPLPDHFIGNVLIDGQNAPVGTSISIYVDSTLEDSVLTTVVGEYDLYVTTGEIDSEIDFKISNILAGNEKRQGGETILLDLSVITTTTTTTPSSGGSSGGSGGGGGGGSSSGREFNSPPTTEINDSNSEEDATQEESQETEKNKEISPGITGAAIGFLGSGKGITAIVILIILGLGVILIKFRPQKWKRISS